MICDICGDTTRVLPCIDGIYRCSDCLYNCKDIDELCKEEEDETP
jgi:hypothetical protein